MRTLVVCFIILSAGTGIALAQQPDPAKLLSVVAAQRNSAADGVAQCSVMVGDLQARIAELEKQISEAKKQ